MYNTYHTSLLLQYKFGILPKQQQASIPSSTLSNWKKREVNKIIGLENRLLDQQVDVLKQIAKNQRLMQLAKALVLICQTYRVIVNTFTKQKEVMPKMGSEVITLIKQTKDVLGFKRLLKAFNITSSQFQYWSIKLKGCERSIQQLCNQKYSNQLTITEVKQIKKALLDPKYAHWSAISVYYQLMRMKLVYCAKATFYKYAHLLGIQRKKVKHRRKKHHIGIRAKKVTEWLHMDVTIYRTKDQTKVYLYVLIDNFSRYMLAISASLSYSADQALKNLKMGLAKVQDNTTEISLMTDDGSENKGELASFVAQTPNINQVIAQKDIILSNSMVEAANKHLKYRYLFVREYGEFKELKNDLPTIIDNYNNKPLDVLHGRTAKEVFENGLLPDSKLFWKEKQEAREKRRIENAQKCCQII